MPPVQEAGDGHTYKCHIPPDELRALQAKDAPAPAASDVPRAEAAPAD